MPIFTLCSMPVAPAGVSHTAACATASLRACGATATMLASRIARGAPASAALRVLDPVRARLRPARLDRAYERRVRRRVLEACATAREHRDPVLVWSWTGQSPELIEELRGHGAIVIAEKYNCMTRTAQRILRDAGARLGVADAAGGITDAVVELEERRTRAADLVSTPAPLVTRSVLDAGIPERCLVETGYGWDPERFRTTVDPTTRASGDPREPVYLFAGRGGVRKGLPMLLDAWRIATDRGLRGRLVIAGDVEPAVRAIRGPILDRSDVEVTGWRRDVGRVFARADAFVFPSLEEGSPICVLEALAHGLPVLTSPMGAGRVVRDGREGYVHDPWDVEALATSMRWMADDGALRTACSLAARRRAARFTWDAVGRRRAVAFERAVERVLVERTAGAVAGRVQDAPDEHPRDAGAAARRRAA